MTFLVTIILWLYFVLPGIIIALLVCVCTIAVLVTLDGIELQIDDIATKYTTKNTKPAGAAESPKFEYLSQPDKQQSISMNTQCQSEQTKFLEFASRIVMLQEHEKIEDSTEGIARKLSCHYVSAIYSSINLCGINAVGILWINYQIPALSHHSILYEVFVDNSFRYKLERLQTVICFPFSTNYIKDMHKLWMKFSEITTSIKTYLLICILWEENVN